MTQELINVPAKVHGYFPNHRVCANSLKYKAQVSLLTNELISGQCLGL
jgi:hypothetical protein